MANHLASPKAHPPERRGSKILLTDEVDPKDLIRENKAKVLGNWIVAEETDANCTDKQGSSLVHMACELNKPEVLAHLYEHHKADLLCQDAQGRMPLHIAALNDSLDCIKFCMAKAAPPDAKDDDGKTPRDYASKAGLAAFESWRDEEVAKHGLIHVEHEEKANQRGIRERHSLTAFNRGWQKAQNGELEAATKLFKQACEFQRDNDEYVHAYKLFPWIEGVKMRGWVPNDHKWRSCTVSITLQELIVRHKKGGFKGLYTPEKEQNYEWHNKMKMQITPDRQSVSLDLNLAGGELVNIPTPFNALRILRMLHHLTGTDEATHEPGPAQYPSPDDDDNISDDEE